MNTLTRIKIVSSHGHFIADTKGNIIERHDESGELPRVSRFYLDGWHYPDGTRPLREEMDILELVYRTESGRLEKPASFAA
jgi:uncharacterized protein YjhX (UPF0386 family)